VTQIPDVIPIAEQDLVIHRCQDCGTVLPGTFGISRAKNQPAIDHAFDAHREALLSGGPTPRFVNCTIQDPFWFDAQAEVSR
jgi:hypothetical protein